METTKLRDIITKKNEQLEQSALRTAEQIIEGIVEQQRRMKAAKEEITALRKELAALDVPQLDPTTILEG